MGILPYHNCTLITREPKGGSSKIIDVDVNGEGGPILLRSGCTMLHVRDLTHLTKE